MVFNPTNTKVSIDACVTGEATFTASVATDPSPRSHQPRSGLSTVATVVLQFRQTIMDAWRGAGSGLLPPLICQLSVEEARVVSFCCHYSRQVLYLTNERDTETLGSTRVFRVWGGGG